MKLQTALSIPAHHLPFGYGDKLLLLGSCFSEHIGNRLAHHKFQSEVNPFGILFHPLAIANVIDRALSKTPFTKEDVFEHQGIWKSFAAHSRLNALSQQEAIDQLNLASETLLTSLQESKYLFITLGTSWYYQHLASQQVVANCHKVPQQAFDKKLMSVSEIDQCLKRIERQVSKINPEAQLIYTISPVRHLKDGMIENNRSKAHLLAGVHQVVNQKNVFYFPAYEILMDELRDYRFYASDMIHPSDQATAYIWEKFLKTFASAEAQTMVDDIAAIQKGLAHKPFHPESEAEKHRLAQLQTKIDLLQQQFPHLIF